MVVYLSEGLSKSGFFVWADPMSYLGGLAITAFLGHYEISSGKIL